MPGSSKKTAATQRHLKNLKLRAGRMIKIFFPLRKMENFPVIHTAATSRCTKSTERTRAEASPGKVDFGKKYDSQRKHAPP